VLHARIRRDIHLTVDAGRSARFLIVRSPRVYILSRQRRFCPPAPRHPSKLRKNVVGIVQRATKMSTGINIILHGRIVLPKDLKFNFSWIQIRKVILLDYQNNYVELVEYQNFLQHRSLFLWFRQNYFDGPTKLFFRSVSSKIFYSSAKSFRVSSC